MKSLALIFIVLSGFAHAFMFQSVPESKAKILQSGKEARYCKSCGMDLVMFYKTSHAAIINGAKQQFCSMHCLADAMKHAKDIHDIKVVDAKSLQWIDAKNAYYVVGSSVKGTMSRISKYAFKNISDAKEFQEKKGGTIMRFSEILK